MEAICCSCGTTVDIAVAQVANSHWRSSETGLMCGPGKHDILAAILPWSLTTITEARLRLANRASIPGKLMAGRRGIARQCVNETLLRPAHDYSATEPDFPPTSGILSTEQVVAARS
jgi:hypothetical protein